MKVFTEVNYIWEDNKLVQTDSKSYEYEGEVARCDVQKMGPWYAKVNKPHSHGTTSLGDIIPDDPSDLINNALNLGGDVISGTVDLGLDVFNEGVSIVTGGMDVTDIMNLSTNIFSQGAGFIDDSLNGAANVFASFRDTADIGWRPEEGILGIGNFSYDMSWWATPNTEQFHSRKLAENMGWLGDKLSGKGYLHDRAEALGNYGRETFNDALAFIKYPQEYMVDDEFYAWVLKLSGVSVDGGGGDGGGGDEGTSKYVKGRGTMKGRSPTLKLNEGAKGLGRKSLRIGTEGMGKPVGGKFQTYKSGRYTRSF